MLYIRSKLSGIVAVTLITGFVFILGCGDSAEQQKMSKFLEEFNQAVSEFAAADQSKKGELEAKLKDYMSKWTQMKFEMGGEVTPQVLEKMDMEYQKIAQEYKKIAQKS